MCGHCGQGFPGCARVGRARQQLELMHGARALSMDGAQAVGARVAAADDHHALAGGRDRLIRRDVVALAAPVLLGQKLHGQVNASELPPGHVQIARGRRSTGEHDRIEFPLQRADRQIGADLDAGTEHDPFLFEDRQAPGEEPFLQFELWNAVAQQPSDAVIPLEDRDRVADTIEVVSRRQSGRAGPDDRDAFAGPVSRRARGDPAFLERALDDRQFDRLDRDRVAVDPEHARALARRRAQSAREFRKVVGGHQPLERRPPTVPIDEVVPVGHEVAQWATLMAEGDAAVHAAGALVPQRLHGVRQVHFVPVADPLVDWPRGRLQSCDLDEARRLTHGRLPPTPRRPARGSRPARALRPAAPACNRAA